MKAQRGFVSSGSASGNGWWQRALRQLRRWHELAHQRRQLARLDSAALKDLGLSRADVLAESERPFWDDPLASHPATKRPASWQRGVQLHGRGFASAEFKRCR